MPEVVCSCPVELILASSELIVSLCKFQKLLMASLQSVLAMSNAITHGQRYRELLAIDLSNVRWWWFFPRFEPWRFFYIVAVEIDYRWWVGKVRSGFPLVSVFPVSYPISFNDGRRIDQNLHKHEFGQAFRLRPTIYIYWLSNFFVRISSSSIFFLWMHCGDFGRHNGRNK